MRWISFDSDVLLDVLAQRQPFVFASAQAFNVVTQPQVQGYVSSHAVTSIFYILRCQVGRKTARELLSRLLQVIDEVRIFCNAAVRRCDREHVFSRRTPWRCKLGSF